VQRHDAHDAEEATATGPQARGDDQPVPARFGDDDEPVTPIGLERIVRVDMVLTAVFVVTAVFAAIVFNGPARVIAVVVALALFAVGTFAFLMGYFVAVGRSRTQEIAVAELYLLTGKALPAAPKRALLWLLGVQIVTALGTALARPNTDGRAGSTLAFGVLVPMLGLGLNGLASARHGAFGPRQRTGAPAPDDATDDTDADEPSDPSDAATGGDGVPPANHDLD
jgi:hypothetical protein